MPFLPSFDLRNEGQWTPSHVKISAFPSHGWERRKETLHRYQDGHRSSPAQQLLWNPPIAYFFSNRDDWDEIEEHKARQQVLFWIRDGPPFEPQVPSEFNGTPPICLASPLAIRPRKINGKNCQWVSSSPSRHSSPHWSAWPVYFQEAFPRVQHTIPGPILDPLKDPPSCPHATPAFDVGAEGGEGGISHVEIYNYGNSSDEKSKMHMKQGENYASIPRMATN
ncbi:hypothetical protein BDK51DRAFT_31796 [Blyttiomyces helicus]|uniref:Uncharacterized protein n=1 Tax=Blyttiomyces helicus TaxID=388810 RepID=A0A4P9WKK8_9FUNG|nr:hypothetical protein BDK51DRAFT_31796 [Blyttiomyces helicus]|eukprot:RKO93521.1 hypothetical protein BDK51DRAFT_31796 [Blyttiomyces helicus]